MLGVPERLWRTKRLFYETMNPDAVVDQALTEMRESSEKRQLLLAQVESATMNQMLKNLHATDGNNVRRSKRLKTTATDAKSKNDIVAMDNLMYEGMEGSLGFNLQKYATSVAAITWKQKYFHFTCANGILDISDSSRLSFLRSLPKEVSIQMLTELTCAKDTEYVDYNLPIQQIFKQINSNNSFQKISKAICDFDCHNDEQESVQEVYKFIFKMHEKKAFIFHQDRQKMYSEQDYIVKFWAPVFETFFGQDEHIFLHWQVQLYCTCISSCSPHNILLSRGDTQAQACKKNDLKMKLDMRVMLMKHGHYVMEGSSCEYAAKATCSKLYKDRLKLVLGAKAYLNEIIENCPHLDDDDIREIRIPYIQVMGFQAVLSVLSIKDKGVYIAEEISKFDFPTTKKQIRKGRLRDLVKALSLLKHLLDNLSCRIEEGKVEHGGNKMARIIEEQKVKKATNGQWLSKLKLPSVLDENDDDADEDDDDDEDEDED
ncbi:uncharacterized protein BYT42DRAFT_102063 [Radiomyces spectabilis]|uniref:uncharacterized protein n=1 Tax=Radiomyces spectabilis TaxID=64574 RepID=UPI00221ED97D|nr:uncharacterized protein BYT42DRAFT_102063 [Radiomyces spectabilis]KAI8369258.1 hypothetical protein BYT42DRAFT_102063 [Radiomyces spectabilis]